MTDPNVTSRIAVAHGNLTGKLTELRRRETRVRTVLAPIRHLANPWVRIGIAAMIGYRLGRPSRSRARVEPAPACVESMTHAVVRASLVALAQVFVRRALGER